MTAPHRSEPQSLKMSREGRILVPAALRHHLGMEPGSDVVASVEDGKLVLESRTNILRRLQDRFSHLPKDVRLADELIAERRSEALHDD